MNESLLPVVLSGGAGTRLFPLSRKNYPKQFLAIGDSKTMFQRSVMRLHGLGDSITVAPPVVVCNEEHRFLAANQLLELGVRDARIILEPAARGTAPALTLATLCADTGPVDPVMLVMPADHVIKDIASFHSALKIGYELAAQGGMVTFGVVPLHAETGYGYIQYHPELAAAAFRIKGFTEKPHLSLAKKYLELGNFLWNSGIFMLRASTWVRAISAGCPDILAHCRASVQSARHDLDFVRPSAELFDFCPADSIDYAVMEKLPSRPDWGISAHVVPLQAGWSDVGSWDAVWDGLEHDSRGNAVLGTSVLHQECSDSLFISTGRLVAGIALNGLVVVETPDAVLVADKRHAQDVKNLVAQLNKVGCTQAIEHRKVYRPWGWYDLIDSGSRFQVKRIVVNPGASLSLQRHEYRAEHWVVVKGVAEVTHGERTFQLQEDESTYIPVGQKHRLRNAGTLPLEIIEVQTGSYLGEDDIVRLDDVYGRAELND